MYWAIVASTKEIFPANILYPDEVQFLFRFLCDLYKSRLGTIILHCLKSSASVLKH